MRYDDLLKSGRIRREKISRPEIDQSLDRAARDLKILYFDRMRNKRNQAIYGAAGLVTETEARTLLGKATEFLKLIRGWLSGRT